MQYLDVRIQRRNDPTPAFPEFIPIVDQIGEGQFGKIAVLEDGTAAGKIAIAFFVEIDDGKKVFAQMTESNFLNLAGIVRGLRQRIDEGN